MKTLLFTLEYPPFKGGVANYYGNLVKFWPEPDNIFVLNNNSGKLLSGKFWPKWLPAIFELRNIIQKEKINHVIAGQILPLGTAAYLLSKISNTKYSVFIHGMDFTLAITSPWKKWISGKILSNTQSIICGNTYTADLVSQFIKSENDKKKVMVVNPGIVDHKTYNPQLVTKIKEQHNLKDNFVLLSVGRLVERKGFDAVLKALPKVLKQYPKFRYVIVGDGPELRNLKKIISNLKLDKNVIIINKSNDEEKNAWYEICDLFIMPARKIGNDYEGFGIVYLEANLLGKPVIAGRSGGVEDAVEDGKNGLLVDPESETEITNAIKKLCADEQLRKKLGEQGRDRALAEFSWNDKIEKIYEIIKRST